MARNLATMVLAVALTGVLLFAFRRHHAVEDSELGAFLPRMEAQAAAWDAQKVPADSRVFDLVISDAQMAAEPLSAPGHTGPFDWVSAWAKRTFQPRREVPPTAFAKAWAKRPRTLVWTHQGFVTASEGVMTREMAKAIVRAHDAGAEVNIVAQGISAVPILRALKSLEGVERGGAKVGVNKVLFVGMNDLRLRQEPSILVFDFRGLGNVRETADVWVPQGQSGNALLQVYTKDKESPALRLEGLFPQLAGRSGELAQLLPVLEDMVERGDSLEQVIVAQQQALAEAAAK